MRSAPNTRVALLRYNGLCPRTQHPELHLVRRQGSETRGPCRRGDATGQNPEERVRLS